MKWFYGLLFVVLASSHAIGQEGIDPNILAKAEAGDVASQIQVSLKYDSGEGVTRDPVKATEWLRKAANQGSAIAENLLGRKCLYGEGVDQSASQAASLFYDSILSTGLGGRDIVEDMGIRRAAQLLLELSAGHSQNEEWLSDIRACERIAADPSKDKLSERAVGFSFRYGGTYLSASSQTAATYALGYSAGGGEALKYTLKLYHHVLAVTPDLATHDQFATLAKFVARPTKPVLVEASGVEVSSLRAEQGGGIKDILERMEFFFEDPDFYDYGVGQHNFELIHPIPPDHLRFHEVTEVREFDGEGGFQDVIKLLPFKQPDA